MYTNNEVLFPQHSIHTLKHLRGEKWMQLIEHILKLPESHEDNLAFMLMMIRLNGCMNCETDSYRAMRGCSTCAHQVLRRFKGSDEELFEIYEKAIDDVRAFALDTEKFDILTLTPLP